MNKEKALWTIKFILMGRVLLSVLFSDILYPNTHNIIEAMAIDLSPYLIFGMGILIYELVIRKYERIVKKYTYGSILPVLIIPLVFMFIIFTLYNKDLIIDLYDEDLAMSTPLYFPSLVMGLNDMFEWLNGKTFLGYNAKVFVTSFFILIVAIIMIGCLIYLFYLMYKLIKSPKKMDGYKEKIFITICTYLLVTINIATVNLYLLYFDKNAFTDFTLSNNAIEALLDTFYFTFKNFIAIGGNEAKSALAKIIVICTTCINIYFFIIFVPMLLSKKETSILSNDEEGQMITKCQFNISKTQRYLMDKIWNEDGKKAVFIGINPSYANGIKGDKTTMTVINYLIDDGFGSLTVLNLFSIIDVDTKSNNEKYATDFEQHREIFENADLILIGWGCQKKKYSDQKEVAENILKEFSEKVYTFVDEKNRQCIHPSKMSKSSKIEQYNFIYLDESNKS